MKILLDNLMGKSKEVSSDFSAFFVDSKSKDKKKLIKSVVRKANNDQKKLTKKLSTYI